MSKCHICQNKSDYKCDECDHKLCMYHVSFKKNKSKKFCICDECKFNSQSKEVLSEIQKSINHQKDRLCTLETEILTIEQEVEKLERQEASMIKKLSEKNAEFDQNIEGIVSQIFLEEKSKNSLNAKIENLCEALENQDNTNQNLLKQLETLITDVESISLEIDHKKYENQELDKEIKLITRQSIFYTDINSLNRVLCTRCKLKVLGNDQVFSLLKWQESKEKKACSSCTVY